MAILKFRVYWEEDDAIYRDILVKHTQSFIDFHTIILKSFEFDQIHAATFYRSNDVWKRGREISKEIYDKEYVATPLLMHETIIGSEIIDTNQHFIYVYDFAKAWTFLIELIQVIKNADADMDLIYPLISRVEGVGPMQYGSKGLLGKQFADIEEKYDLSEATDGFGEEGEEADGESEDADDETDESTDDAGSGFLDDSFEAY
jgi:hypothetical protein